MFISNLVSMNKACTVRNGIPADYSNPSGLKVILTHYGCLPYIVNRDVSRSENDGIPSKNTWQWNQWNGIKEKSKDEVSCYRD